MDHRPGSRDLASCGGPIELPTSAVVEQVRALSGLKEQFTVNEDCRVIVASAGDLLLELAVLSFEVVTALQALALTTGGGWRVPTPTIGTYDMATKD
jgi:hypothetical protein